MTDHQHLVREIKVNNKWYAGLAALILSFAPGALLAQDYEYHPYLSDTFSVSLGAMRSSNSFKVRASKTEDRGDDIDFDDSLGVSQSSTFFNGQFRWKFGSKKKWSLAGQYFSNNATGKETLKEDVEWEDVVFREGSFVQAGIKLAVARAFVGRSFVKNAQHDFGVGIGIHNLDLSAHIEGEIRVNDGGTDIQRREVSASAPLPNLGGWYVFSPAKKWMLHSRADWISANVGDYDGGLWNIAVGVNYQAWRNVGFDLTWQYFNLDVNVDKTDWKGGAELTYNGPVLGVTFNW